MIMLSPDRSTDQSLPPLVVGTLAIVFTAQMLAWPAAMLTTGGGGLAVGWLATSVWAASCLLGIAALVLWWRRRLAPALCWAIAVVTAGIVLAGGVAARIGYDLAFAHPSFATSVGIVTTVVAACGVRQGWPLVATVALAWTVGVSDTVTWGASAWSAFATNAATIVGVPLVVGFVVPRVLTLREARRQGQAELVALRAALAADQARESERVRQYRTLHDTVLSTLSAVARGTLDVSEPAVRQRLSREADYLRGLIATSTSTAGMQLVGELARITRDQSHSGLRVHPHIGDVPDQLPADVVRAVGAAIEEALTNVVKHAGVLEAWVTIVGRDTGVDVTVTDRGKGFDVGSPSRGLGLRNSIKARMAEVGGAASIDSQVAEGTTVELRWPA